MKSMHCRTASVIVWATLVVSGCFLLFQALSNAPTGDEAGHLVSGIAMVQSGDPGFYRVNPPLHKLVSGLSVEVAVRPKMPPLYPASMMASGARQEFDLANEFFQLHPNDYQRSFVVGRLVRIPIILFAGWMLLRGLSSSLRMPGAIATMLWLTSPLVLGHGWAILPDAMSSAAMVLLMVTTLAWLKSRKWPDFLTVGIAWGLAIGTKFTFCPIYVLWPIGLMVHQWMIGDRNWRMMIRLPLCHIGHGVIALLVVIGLYGAVDLGISLQQHSLKSGTLVGLTEGIGWMPSPFPKQFLVGIDEQQLDLEHGLPTYFMGKWYPHGMWWYYLLGLLVKEQIAFTLGLFAVIFGGARLWWHGAGAGDTSNRELVNEQRACLVFCLLIAAMVLGILSWHKEMALNVRYVFPALPALYLAIGIGFASLFSSHAIWLRRTLLLVAVIVIGELAWNCPHYFAYANPIFGGSYRVPPVLHDSNFDGGQDLWRLEHYLANHPAASGQQRFVAVHSPVPDLAFRFSESPPTASVIAELVTQNQRRESTSMAESNVELIVMRGLGVPSLWTHMSGGEESNQLQLLEELLLQQPGEWVTPTLVIFRGRMMQLRTADSAPTKTK